MKKDKLAILCVDDEEVVLKSLLYQLREYYGAKYYYEVATSGEEALEIIDELVSDNVYTILLITDWLMPGMKGDEFVSIVNRKYPNIVKIMLTGQATNEAIKDAKENSDLFSCVKKPWDKDSLMSMIESALGERDE